MNKELRTKLKKVDTVVSSFGYALEIRFDDVRISPLSFDTNRPENWIRLKMMKSYSSDNKICSLSFNAEPGVTTCGSTHLTIEFSKAICKHWKDMLNACDTLNSLHIIGSPLEISECVRDILLRKRKV